MVIAIGTCHPKLSSMSFIKIRLPLDALQKVGTLAPQRQMDIMFGVKIFHQGHNKGSSKQIYLSYWLFVASNYFYP